jgi:hypothetical protein
MIGKLHANTLAKEGSTGGLPADVDVAIIDAGITGIMTAYHLGECLEGHKKPRVANFKARELCIKCLMKSSYAC